MYRCRLTYAKLVQTERNTKCACTFLLFRYFPPISGEESEAGCQKMSQPLSDADKCHRSVTRGTTFFPHFCINIQLFLITFAKNKTHNPLMNKVRITAMRQTVYKDLMEKYENPIQHACDVRVGQQWVFNPTLSDVPVDEQCPEGLCPSAWHSMKEFAVALAKGEGNFYDGWMQNPMSAMISCNDGFRPLSFYLEVIDD